MFHLAAALMLAGYAPPPPTIQAEARKAYGACLRKFMNSKLAEKMDANAYRTAAKAACQTEEAGFRAAWISFDTGNGAKASEASQNANGQIDEYIDKSLSDYQDNGPKS
jgi:hypothetical protein